MMVHWQAYLIDLGVYLSILILDEAVMFGVSKSLCGHRLVVNEVA